MRSGGCARCAGRYCRNGIGVFPVRVTYMHPDGYLPELSTPKILCSAQNDRSKHEPLRQFPKNLLITEFSPGGVRPFEVWPQTPQLIVPRPSNRYTLGIVQTTKVDPILAAILECSPPPPDQAPSPQSNYSPTCAGYRARSQGDRV